MNTYKILNEAQIDSNFESLCDLVQTVCGPGWLSMVLNLGPNTEFEGVTFFGLKQAPAAKGNHHAYLGGLVEHLLEMWNTYRQLDCSVLYNDPLLTDTRVLKGIVSHDLHKAWCTFVQDLKVDSGLNYGVHPSNSLLKKDQKSVYILSQANIQLDLIDMNCLFCSEGGWADSHPKWSTTLAKLVYLLDEMSGNVKARSLQGNNIDLRRPTPFPNLWELQFPR